MIGKLLGILLFASLAFASYPATPEGVSAAISQCRDNECVLSTMACTSACDEDYIRCESPCPPVYHGGATCHAACDSAKEACSNDCAFAFEECTQDCLARVGFPECAPIYRYADFQPFFDCAVGTVGNATPENTPSGTSTPHSGGTTPGQAWEDPCEHVYCNEGEYCWEGECHEEPECCGSAFVLLCAGLLTAGLFASRSRH